MTLVVGLSVVALPGRAVALETDPDARSAARSQYAAIALGKYGRTYGYSFRYATRTSAKQRAKRECRDRGGSRCRVVISIRDGCIAVAARYERRGGGQRSVLDRYATALGPTRQVAEDAARALLQTTPNLRVWACSG